MPIVLLKKKLPLLDRNSLFSSSSKMEFNLRAFESHISKQLSQLSLSSTHNALPTLSWLRECLHLLPTIEKAFTKLISDIDHPMNAWEITSVEHYLKDSLRYLNLLNSITSSVSHLQQARLATEHALSSSLKPIEIPSNIIINKDNKWGYREETEEDEKEKGLCCSKEEILNQALRVMKRVRSFVCVVVESGIRGDVELFVESLNGAGELFSVSSGLGVNEEILRRNGVVVREVDEINAGLGCVVGNTVGGVQEKVQELGKKLESVGEDVNQLFSEALAQRNHLLDSFQQRKQS